MSFLAPFFLAVGGLAIALPIVFHLLRRTPRGRKSFSSLMFLEASPPRFTRRSRLENWPLLLLRAMVVLLLALAFGRPFLRAAWDMLTPAADGEHVVVLVDDSASMQRGELWIEAAEAVEQSVVNLRPQDQAELWIFSHRTASVVSAEQWNAEPQERRASMFMGLDEMFGPSMGGTRLDHALITAVEHLEQGDGAPREASGESPTAGSKEGKKSAAPSFKRRRIVVIGDMQAGSRLSRLQGYAWPKDVPVDVVALPAPEGTNAGMQWVQSAEIDDQPDRPRVRVSNAAGGRKTQFRLTWIAGREEWDFEPSNEAPQGGEYGPVDVHVPAGETRVVRGPRLPPGQKPGRLVLTGDDHPFDNQLWLAPAQPQAVQVLFVGRDGRDDPQGSLYFLPRAFPPTWGRTVEVVSASPDSDDLALLAQGGPTEGGVKFDRPPPLVVVGEMGVWGDRLKQWMDQGTTVLWTPREGDGPALAAFAGLAADTKLVEAPVKDYALLADVDVRHPWFAPFADPRFRDFTKIHIWKRRAMEGPLGESPLPSGVRTLAKFDDQGPAVLEFPREGKPGRLFVMLTGWNTADSQLAVSSKFAPLMNVLLDQSLPESPAARTYTVGDVVKKTGGAIVESTATGGLTTYPRPKSDVIEMDEPYLYAVENNGLVSYLAANLAPEESRTEPLSIDALIALGVPAEHAAKSRAARREGLSEEERRLLASRELEQRQQIWRYLLAAALVLMIGETWYAARCTRMNTLPVGAEPAAGLAKEPGQ